MKQAVCLIATKPSRVWLEFLNNFKHYDVYVCTMFTHTDYAHVHSELYPNVRFVQIDNAVCSSSGYKNFSQIKDTCSDVITEIDKAYCFFASYNKSYDRVWMISENAFLYDEETLQRIDTQYPFTNYLTGYNYERCIKPHDDYWPHLKCGDYYENGKKIHLSPPFYKSYPVVSRLTKESLRVLREYIYRVGSGFFYEVMITTLMKQHNVSYEVVDALTTVVPTGWENWKYCDINTRGVFHPVPVKHQRKLRAALRSGSGPGHGPVSRPSSGSGSDSAHKCNCGSRHKPDCKHRKC